VCENIEPLPKQMEIVNLLPPPKKKFKAVEKAFIFFKGRQKSWAFPNL